MDRRKFLKSLGIVSTVSLAGCQTSNNTPTNNPSPNQNTGSLPDQNEITIVSEGIEFVPVVNEENGTQSAQFTMDVTDQDGLEEVELFLENKAQEEPVKLLEDQPEGAETIPATPPFSPTHIAPGENWLRAKITDTTGKTETYKTTPFTVETAGHQIDLKNTNGKNTGNYNTERTWDNLHVNKNGRVDQLIQKWHQEALYPSLLTDLKKDKNDPYNTELTGFPFTNERYGDAEKGHWDLERFQNHTELKQILLDTQTVLRIKQAVAHEGPPSGFNGRFAATGQEIINELNQEAKQYQEENNGNKLAHWGTVTEGGHGSTVLHVDLENSEIEGEHPWMYVNTTSRGREPVTKNIRIMGDFNPFIMGYEAEEQTDVGLGYDTEKDKSTGALLSFSLHDNAPEEFNYNMSFNDELLETIFNEHVPDGGSIDPILNLDKQLIDAEIQTDGYAVAVGENIEVTENEQGDEVFEGVNLYTGEELYEKCLDPETQLTQDKAEQYLEENWEIPEKPA